jgi:hypothetical protein
MKRHRKTCLDWQSRDSTQVARERLKQTNLERYGVEDVSQTPEVRARRTQTNLERYGAGNPFCRESSIFEQVQERSKESHVSLCGQDNPFAWPEVKEKVRAYWQREHGVDNPQQVPEIRGRVQATNLERYGVEEILSLPDVRERIRDTCEALYGGPAPSCDPEVVEKARKTNQERYGVDWTCQDPDVRRRQLEAMEAHYGSHYFASEEGKADILAAIQGKYGVDHWMKTEGAWDKLVTVFQEKFGVDHPLQLEEFREKQQNTNIQKYGTPFPGLCTRGPNLLERRVHRMCPELLFTGDGAFWKRLPKLERFKNPDFIVPGPNPANPKKGVTKVVEVFGDFWHSRLFTGKAPFVHEQELIEAFLGIGIQCLVIWESEVKKHPDEVVERIKAFLMLPSPKKGC